MQIGTKFSVSIHILLCVEFFKDKCKVTSDFLAESVKTNPVVIRKLMSALKKKAAKISFLDIFNAVESIKDGKLFKIHDTSPNECPVAQKINLLLDGCFLDAQTTLEKKLNSFTLQSILNKIKDIQIS